MKASGIGTESWSRAFTVALAILACGSWARAQDAVPVAPVLKMITEAWPPWITDEGGKGAGGVFAGINRELCRRADVRYEIRFYPWQRCLSMMKSGQADVLLMLEKDAGRERYMHYSEPVLKDENLVYFRSDAPRQSWQSWKDLEGLTIGVTGGYTFGDAFETARKAHRLRLDPATTDTQTLLKLVGGRFPAAIVNRTVAREFFRTHPQLSSKVTAAAKPASSAMYYLAFSRRSKRQDLLPRLNEAIRSMKADGTIDRLTYEGLGRSSVD